MPEGTWSLYVSLDSYIRVHYVYGYMDRINRPLPNMYIKRDRTSLFMKDSSKVRFSR